MSVTSGSDDVPAEPTYRAESIVADGYLDLAVLQITGDADGNAVDLDSLDLPEPLPLGSSGDVRTGDEITALGYPAIGNVGRAAEQAADGDPRRGLDLPGRPGDRHRARLHRLRRAAGLGQLRRPSINDAGEIIGINTAVITANSDSAGAITSGSALIRPVDLAADILRDRPRRRATPTTSRRTSTTCRPPTDLPADVGLRVRRLGRRR